LLRTRAGRPADRRSCGSNADGRRSLFIVFGHQRTGSTLVANRLNSHDKIVCYEELFLPWVDSEPSLRGWLASNSRPQWLRAVPGVRPSFLGTLFDPANKPGEVGAMGFKVMYNQLSLSLKVAYLAPRLGRLIEDPSLKRWLSMNHVYVIHTLRRDHLKVLVSHQIAAESGRFHSREEAVAQRAVTVPLLGLQAKLARIESSELAARAAVRNLKSTEIYYEDYTAAPNDYDNQLCQSLGVPMPEHGLTSPLSKMANDDLSNVVDNFHQVKDHLRGTRFERFTR
jgi:LPS sulfotransferase NodH